MHREKRRRNKEYVYTHIPAGTYVPVVAAREWGVVVAAGVGWNRRGGRRALGGGSEREGEGVGIFAQGGPIGRQYRRGYRRVRISLARERDSHAVCDHRALYIYLYAQTHALASPAVNIYTYAQAYIYRDRHDEEEESLRECAAANTVTVAILIEGGRVEGEKRGAAFGVSLSFCRSLRAAAETISPSISATGRTAKC